MKKFGLEESSHKHIPAATHVKLTKDDHCESVDQSLYRSMIISLFYLTSSRLDISYLIGVCARYQSNPKVSHITQVKRIIRYISGTADLVSCIPLMLLLLLWEIVIPIGQEVQRIEKEL